MRPLAQLHYCAEAYCMSGMSFFSKLDFHSLTQWCRGIRLTWWLFTQRGFRTRGEKWHNSTGFLLADWIAQYLTSLDWQRGRVMTLALTLRIKEICSLTWLFHLYVHCKLITVRVHGCQCICQGNACRDMMDCIVQETTRRCMLQPKQEEEVRVLLFVPYCSSSRGVICSGYMETLFFVL